MPAFLPQVYSQPPAVSTTSHTTALAVPTAPVVVPPMVPLPGVQIDNDAEPDDLTVVMQQPDGTTTTIHLPANMDSRDSIANELKRILELPHNGAELAKIVSALQKRDVGGDGDSFSSLDSLEPYPALRESVSNSISDSDYTAASLIAVDDTIDLARAPAPYDAPTHDHVGNEIMRPKGPKVTDGVIELWSDEGFTGHKAVFGERTNKCETLPAMAERQRGFGKSVGIREPGSCCVLYSKRHCQGNKMVVGRRMPTLEPYDFMEKTMSVYCMDEAQCQEHYAKGKHNQVHGNN